MRSLFRRWAKGQGGAAALVFAVGSVVMLMAVGSGVDLSRQAYLRSRVSDAVDAAALGLIGKTSPEFVQAAKMNGDGDLTGAQSDARAIFDATMRDQVDATIQPSDFVVTATKSGRIVSARVSVTASIPTYFMGMAGVKTMTVNAHSAVENDLPTYMDFYLLLDNSPSMGLGATPTDVSTMVNNTPDQCAFACHELDTTKNYYSLARNLGVTLRIDVVRQATQQMMDTATATETLPGQFRMEIATFGQKAEAQGYTPIIPSDPILMPPTSNLSAAKTAAAAVDLMTIPAQGYNNDRQTDYKLQMTAANAVIPSPGDGSSAAQPQKVLFLVTDGANDAPLVDSCNPGDQPGGARCISPMNTALCDTMKKRGIRIAVLYTTNLPVPGWWQDHVKPWAPQIAPALQSCASPGLYFEVSPTQGIADAMSALFVRAVQTARIIS